MGARWHEALAYAVTGRRVDGLGEQDRPDVPGLAARLAAGPGGRADLARAVAALRAGGGAWPVPVPADLRAGLGPAQFAAALDDLVRRLGLAAGPGGRVRADRPLSEAERRLAADRPPHHGG